MSLNKDLFGKPIFAHKSSALLILISTSTKIYHKMIVLNTRLTRGG
jgi:hypothetical protein